MIKSMTGFGRYEASKGSKKFSVELKGVNHRYLEAGIRMPKQFNCFEGAIRSLLKEYAVRGKIDIFITYEDLSESGLSLTYNRSLAEQYVKCFEQMGKDFAIEDDMRASVLARMPEVLGMKEAAVDENELWELMKEALTGAFGQFEKAREKEGENLKRDILGKLSKIKGTVAYIEGRSPEITSMHCRKITDKASELLGDRQIDESRLAEEMVLFADRICTDEEIVRLKSHIGRMEETVQAAECCGKELDFIAQEMMREANTILSKAYDIEISDRAITLKTEIEKVREQVQNIE